jgi:hypothetical protein
MYHFQIGIAAFIHVTRQMESRTDSMQTYRTTKPEPCVQLASNPSDILVKICTQRDRLCGLVVRVVGYRSGGPGSIPGTTRKKNVVGLERGSLSLVSTN